MLLRDVLDKAHLKLTPLTGRTGAERVVSRVHVTDLPDPGRYLAAGDLVLTGLMWHHGPDDCEVFVAALARAGVTALGAGDAVFGSVPADLVAACRQHGVPLFEVPVEVSFRDIVDEVGRSGWARRASGLAAELGRHRGLVAAVAGGARLSDLLPAVAADLGISSWVLTPTGRVVAGTGTLPPGAAATLARGFLAAERLPTRVTVDGRAFTVVAVPGRPEHRLTSWLVACAGSAVADVSVLPDGVDELTSLVALERAHLDEAERVERRLAGQLRAVLTTNGGAAELGAALRATRLAPDATFLVVTATLAGPRPPVGLPSAVVGEVVRTVAPGAVVADPDPDRSDGVLAVLPVAPDAAAPAVERLREAVAALVPALADGRLAVGLSAPAAGAAGLPAAVEEARHAHRCAAGRDGPVPVVAAGELASYALLLAGVPVRSRRAFRARLLGPLAAYDRTHGADLLRTLDAFLACGGSWSRCAADLHVHVNTLRYRIGRIQQLTGRDLTRFEDRVDFFLALRLPPG